MLPLLWQDPQLLIRVWFDTRIQQERAVPVSGKVTVSKSKVLRSRFIFSFQCWDVVSDSPGWPPTHYVCSSGWPPKPDTPASIFWMLRLHTGVTMPGDSGLRTDRRAPYTVSKHFTDWVIAPGDLIIFSFTILLYQNHNPKQPVFKCLFFNVDMNKDPLALPSLPSQAIISFLFEVFQGSFKIYLTTTEIFVNRQGDEQGHDRPAIQLYIIRICRIN